MKVGRILAIAAFVPSVLLAGGLSQKYKDWPNSPQGFFMTQAERSQWAAVKTDADAEQFVNQFIASRGPGFVDDVAKRAEMADKHLTIGSLPGSKTLRGKIIVLLGPPTGFSVASREVGGNPTSGASYGMSDAGGASVGDMAAAATRQGMSGTSIREYTIKYDARKLPPSFDSDLTVVIEADASNGKDRLANARQQADLDKLFEMVAVLSRR